MIARAARLIAAMSMLWLGLASAASAHAALTGAAPADGAILAAAPARYNLSFSEPVSPLTLQLIRPQGKAITLERYDRSGRTLEIDIPADLSDGTHVLAWRVISTDGHPVAGAVSFSIGAPSATPPVVLAAPDQRVRVGLWLTRVALYLGLFFGIGGVFAITWLFPRSRSGKWVVSVALGSGFIGAVLSPGFQGLDALGATLAHYGDPLIWETGLRGSYGRTVVTLLGALLVACLALPTAHPARARLLAVGGLIAGAAALALSGHASAADPQWLTRPAVFLHAATIALWTGALVPLCIALRAGAEDATAGLRSFSAFIPFAVIVLILTGATLAIIQVEHPAALLQTAYGRLLTAKLVLLGGLFALAAINRWRLTAPALRAEYPARRRLIQMIAAETLTIAIIFGIAAGWRFTPPPRAIAIAAAQPVSLHIHGADAMADLTVTPGRVGTVAVSAIIMTSDFGPLDARKVTFVFSHSAAGAAPFQREAEKPGDGTWRADNVLLPLPGLWTLGVDILIDDFELTRLQGEVEIRP